MHEALYQFIHAHYTEILAVFPTALLLIGLVIAVGIDQYILRQKKRIMLIICALVFSLIVQNYLDNLLTYGTPMITLRKAVDIYGYAARPVILLLFLYIVSPKKPSGLWWVLIGINAGIYLTAMFTDICFTIDEENRFRGGWPVLRNSCLIVSVILLATLLFSTLHDYRPSKRKETWVLAFSVCSIPLALLLDSSVHETLQPV
ncbi:MAG: hypothetical protein K5919_01860, partial [Clostridiales bacterium]|nr:hypothetical protein [Clostridiales bacterium]